MGKRPTCDEAWKIHRASKYPRYLGAQIEGQRFELKRGEKGYPPAFERINNPPETLYGVGNVLALTEGLAVVGARKATPYGLECTRLFAGRAAERGIAIISGGAAGCDTAAHQAALLYGAPTVVFLGGGTNELYPATNYELFQKVVDAGGALVSENTWDYPPLPHTFRARNRLIAGLAKATLIVEAGLPSGTFSTADEALIAGREVLVVPGSICSATSKGANRLLFQGATPVIDLDCFDDILFSLFGCLKQESVGGKLQEKEDDFVLAALRANPLRMEELLVLVEEEVKAGGGAGALESLMLRLADLQKGGEITRYPDGRFGPCKI